MTTKTKVLGVASDWIQSVKSSVGGGLGSAEEFIRKHPVTSAVTLGGGVLAATQIIRVARKKSKAPSKSKKSVTRKAASKRKKYHGHTRRGWIQDRARRSKEKHEIAYQKRKKRLKKSSKKPKRLIKGSKEAKAYMKKIRKMRKGGGR